MSWLKDYRFGIIIGFLFGLVTPFLAALGLVSAVMGIIGLIFRFPGQLISQFAIIQTDPNTYNASIAMPLFMLLNGLFYALIGGLLQKWLKKKKYVAFIFLGVILLIILIIFIEGIIRSALGLHVGP